MMITTVPIEDFKVPVKPGQIFERAASPVTIMVTDTVVIKCVGSRDERKKAVADFKASQRRYKRRLAREKTSAGGEQ